VSLPRIAVIGAGAWGSNHVRVVAAHRGCELVAVVDPDRNARERARILAPNVAVLADPDRVFADRSIDAVIIATPAASHADLSCAALAAGKHVLVEKPVTVSIASAHRIAETVKHTGQTFMVGHLMLFHPALIQLRDLLRSGALGRLQYLHSIRANLGRIRRDESALWSFGPHELSMLDYLLDEQPVSVAAHAQCVALPEVADVVFVTLRYASGVMAHLHLSRLHPRKERSLKLVCSDKVVEFNDVSAEKLQIFGKGYDRPPNFTQFAEYLIIPQGDVQIPKVVLEEPLALQFRHFLECLATGSTPRTDIRSALRIVGLLEAAERSCMREGIPVDVKTATPA